MSIISSEIVKESRKKITIVKIIKSTRPSKYMDGDYTLVRIIDQHGRKITAAGWWVEYWKEGDEVEGVLQEKAGERLNDFQEKEVFSSLYLANPDRE